MSQTVSTVVSVETSKELESIAKENRWSISFTTRIILEEGLKVRREKAGERIPARDRGQDHPDQEQELPTNA